MSKSMRPSVAFRLGERETIAKVLDMVDNMSARHVENGFNEKNFTFGVMGTLLLSYGFGAYPEHFWLMYSMAATYMISHKFYNMVNAKPLNEAFYYFDFCWMMNFLALTMFFFLGTAKHFNIQISHDMRRNLFQTCFGVSTGPLLGATAALPFVAFIFHDINVMTGSVIHLLPGLLMFTMRWHSKEIKDAWGGIFELDYIDDITFQEVARNTIMLYIVWYIPFVIWMVVIGMDLPRKNRRKIQRDGKTPRVPVYDTVFHSLMRSGLCELLGANLWKRPRAVSRKQVETNDFELRDFAVYMALHAIAVVTAIFVGAGSCFASQMLYQILLVLVTLICVIRGAKRYTYYATAMYSTKLRKQFSVEVVDDDENEKKKD